MPGITPAKNSAATETPPTDKEYIMNRSDVETYGIGAGAYFGMVYGLIFYPSIVVGFLTSAICIDHMNMAIGDGYVWGIIATIVFIFSIVILQILRKWKAILTIYVITLWPFINIVKWIYSGHLLEDGTWGTGPFPGLDWIPFF